MDIDNKNSDLDGTPGRGTKRSAPDGEGDANTIQQRNVRARVGTTPDTSPFNHNSGTTSYRSPTVEAYDPRTSPPRSSSASQVISEQEPEAMDLDSSNNRPAQVETGSVVPLIPLSLEIITSGDTAQIKNWIDDRRAYLNRLKNDLVTGTRAWTRREVIPDAGYMLLQTSIQIKHAADTMRNEDPIQAWEMDILKGRLDQLLGLWNEIFDQTKEPS
ncbi:hypothetical protein V8F20_003308 [Naviculisporaceae sp. PSN 640]